MLLPTRADPQTGQDTKPRAAWASNESLDGNQLSKAWSRSQRSA